MSELRGDSRLIDFSGNWIKVLWNQSPSIVPIPEIYVCLNGQMDYM